MPALPPYIIEPIWQQFSALLPERRTDHPLGCHRSRIPERVVFEKLDRFVEMKLSGLVATQAMALVQEHIEICGECREEFEALLAALRATGEG